MLDETRGDPHFVQAYPFLFNTYMYQYIYCIVRRVTKQALCNFHPNTIGGSHVLCTIHGHCFLLFILMFRNVRGSFPPPPPPSPLVKRKQFQAVSLPFGDFAFRKRGFGRFLLQLTLRGMEFRGLARGGRKKSRRNAIICISPGLVPLSNAGVTLV